MERINYFAPYESKKQYHEDQLTLAFLVVLRYVSLAQVAFLDLVREIQMLRNAKFVVPTLSAIGGKRMEVQTQVPTIEQESGKLISIIMTDKEWKPEGQVTATERYARYDGVVCFPFEWLLVIENKPHSSSIWEGQANPSLPEEHEIDVDPTVVVILWKDLITRLTCLLERNLLRGAEELILEDFLQFIHENHDYLNPYSSLAICKDNPYLLGKRCVDIMEKLAPDCVTHHRGWEDCIQLSLRSVREIALSPRLHEAGDWDIELEMYPGDAVNQDRHLFDRVNMDAFLSLGTHGWQIRPNLHFAFMSTNLFWGN